MATKRVLPMYMGVILMAWRSGQVAQGAPHVYGGDPLSLPVIF